ncbi:MAG: NifU family protein [Ilumatobacteraceae bacterium]|nr:NifU family protein [Ilumatobacteraceae bacterium]
MSPLAPQPSAVDSGTIITITDDALAELIKLRDAEEDAASLGLRLEIVSGAGEEFKYDLSLDEFRKAAFTDEVRTHGGMKVIIPAKDLELLQGAVLDYASSTGLVIRNPNKPVAMVVEGLVSDDVMSAEIEAVIATEVNPALAAHGGFVTFVGHDGEGTAYLTMGGGCHGCSMSRMTMLEGVQTQLVEKVDGLERVRDLTDHTSGENPFYR